MTENEISHVIIGAAIEVHKELGGPGLLEQVYEEALCHELALQKLNVARQKVVPIHYKGVSMSKHLVLDVMVEGSVVVEVKAT